jgi:hypothetical protein
MDALIKALAPYGPWAVLLGALAWQSPKILKEILEYRHKEREAQRVHQRTVNKLMLDLQRKKDKLARREARRGKADDR